MILLTSDTAEVTDKIADTITSTTEENVKQVNVFFRYLQDKIPDAIGFGMNVIFALLIFLIGVKVIKWIRKFIRGSLERTSVEIGMVQFLDSIVKYGLYFILITIIARSFGIESTSVAALLASGGVAVGLALQGCFSNIAGGVLLMILKPFVVGDYIISGTYEGTITEIQIYYSKMLTVDNRAIIIPNGELSGHSLINVTRENERRLDLQIGISYESDLKRAKEVLHEIVLSDEDVIKSRDILIVVDELADSAVVIGVKVWVPTDRYFPAKWRILENVKLGLDENGIEIPYNRIEVHMQESGNRSESGE